MKEKIKKIVNKSKIASRIIYPLNAFIKHIIKFLIYGYIDPTKFFIFKKKKIIYIVNSKVAQTSITNTCGNPDKGEYAGVEKELGEKKLWLNKEEKSYYTFTFVRNPFERLYSCHKSKYIADKQKYNRPILDFDYYLLGFFKKDPGFRKFVKRVSKIHDRFSDRHFKSQYALIYKNNFKKPDYVGRYETLREDFETVRSKYDLDELPHLNKSREKDNSWMDNYDQELIDIVYKRYKKDFDTWYPNAKKEIEDYINKKSN
jgi:hypothetical protein